jgi:hypothetical protein
MYIDDSPRMYCCFCGSQLPEEAQSCQNCGTAVQAIPAKVHNTPTVKSPGAWFVTLSPKEALCFVLGHVQALNYASSWSGKVAEGMQRAPSLDEVLAAGPPILQSMAEMWDYSETPLVELTANLTVIYSSSENQDICSLSALEVAKKMCDKTTTPERVEEYLEPLRHPVS